VLTLPRRLGRGVMMSHADDGAAWASQLGLGPVGYCGHGLQ
jgi:hypothetical protein